MHASILCIFIFSKSVYVFLTMNRLSYFISIAVIGLLTSCAIQKKSAVSSELTYQDFSEQPVSVVNIPVTVDLSQFYKEAEASVSKTYSGQDEPCQGLRYSYDFTRSPIQFNGESDKINIAFRGTYKMNMSYCAACAFDRCVVPAPAASCGVDEPERRLDIGFAMSYQLTPDYGLLSTTSLTKLTAVDPCKITFLNVDISDRITEIVRGSLNDICKQYDQETAKTNLKQPLQTAWDSLTAPTKLDDGAGYFSLHPQTIGITPFQFSGSLLKFYARLTIKPVLYSEQPRIVFKKLPPLSSVKPSDGFNVCTDLLLNYDSLTQILSPSIKGKTVMMKNKKVVIEQINIKGAANNRLSFHIAFSGYKNGVVRISGHPYLVQDSLLAGLAATNIHFEKGSFLLKSAFRLFKKKIRKAVADNSNISLREFAEQTRISIEKSLNRTIQQQYQLTGKVSQLKLTDVYASEKHLKIRTWTTGGVGLFIRLEDE